MLAGAVVATALQQPFLVIPAALMSHFVLDVIPHFGIEEDQPVERNQHPLFRYILAIDVLMVLSFLAMLPLVLTGVVSRWVLLTGMVVAWIPDLVWIRGFMSEVRTKVNFTRYSWLSHFHQRIQWFERPSGLVVELIWFGAMATLLGILAA